MKKIKTVLGHLFWDQEELFSGKNQHHKSCETFSLSSQLNYPLNSYNIKFNN